MNVAFLGPDNDLVRFIESTGSRVWRTEDRVDDLDADFIVSYGYRHILSQAMVNEFDGRAINLHIGYLPYNRGAHPLYWAIREGTPVGVSIHYIDRGIDTGDIIAQKQVAVTGTLSTGYMQLKSFIEALFKVHWRDIRRGTCQRIKQTSRGTYHDKQQFESVVLPKGWLTPLEEVKPLRRVA